MPKSVATAGLSLTWQAGSGGRGGRWRKIYKGILLYYDGGQGINEKEAYSLANYHHWIDCCAIDDSRVLPSKRPGGWPEYYRRRDAEHERQEEWRRLTSDFSGTSDEVLQRTQAAPEETSIGTAITSYLNGRPQDVRAGTFRPKSFSRLEVQLRYVTAFSSDRAVSDINGRWIDDYRRYLLGLIESGRLAQESAASVAGVTRSWISWLYETKRLDAFTQVLETSPNRSALKTTGNVQRGIETDLVSQAIKRHFRRKDLKELVGERTARHLRKSGASWIKSDERYHDLDATYLSHAAVSVADRHYSRTPFGTNLRVPDGLDLFQRVICILANVRARVVEDCLPKSADAIQS